MLLLECEFNYTTINSLSPESYLGKYLPAYRMNLCWHLASSNFFGCASKNVAATRQTNNKFAKGSPFWPLPLRENFFWFIEQAESFGCCSFPPNGRGQIGFATLHDVDTHKVHKQQRGECGPGIRSERTTRNQDMQISRLSLQCGLNFGAS